MSRRPQATPSRPNGSTHANSAKTPEARLTRTRQHNLSPFPRKSKNQKRTDRALGRKRF